MTHSGQWDVDKDTQLTVRAPASGALQVTSLDHAPEACGPSVCIPEEDMQETPASWKPIFSLKRTHCCWSADQEWATNICYCEPLRRGGALKHNSCSRSSYSCIFPVWTEELTSSILQETAELSLKMQTFKISDSSPTYHLSRFPLEHASTFQGNSFVG